MEHKELGLPSMVRCEYQPTTPPSYPAFSSFQRKQTGSLVSNLLYRLIAPNIGSQHLVKIIFISIVHHDHLSGVPIKKLVFCLLSRIKNSISQTTALRSSRDLNSQFDYLKCAQYTKKRTNYLETIVTYRHIIIMYQLAG